MKSLWLIALVCFSARAADSLFFTDPDRAFRDAKASHKPLLIDFYGIWCPPCNELEENVFESAEFLGKAKAFTLLKLDVDKPEAQPLREKFQIQGFPTILFLTPDGVELYRFSGYRAAKSFVGLMDLVLASGLKPLASLCARADAESQWGCARYQMDRNDFAAARRTLGKLTTQLPKTSLRYQIARGYPVETEKRGT
jgi:thiol-disulfide isomerase/thioredoxin